MTTSLAHFKRATISLLLITLAYVSGLVIIDAEKNILSELHILSTVLPLAAILSLLSYFLRYCRWHWLLRRAGHSLQFSPGFLSYISGFALTATPGKIGELLRIRYFSRYGVPHKLIIAAFIFERAFDLIAVLLIALLAAFQLGAFTLIFSFVLIVITAVMVLSTNTSWLGHVTVRLRAYRLRKLSIVIKTLKDGLHGLHHWITPLDVSISMVLGLMAWLLASCAFVWIIFNLEIDIPMMTLIAIYPIAMLIGAASMLPGGIGSTEAAIVALLALMDTPIAIATVAAIGIRVSSLWFSIVCGIAAMLILEYQYTKHTVH